MICALLCTHNLGPIFSSGKVGTHIFRLWTFMPVYIDFEHRCWWSLTYSVTHILTFLILQIEEMAFSVFFAVLLDTSLSFVFFSSFKFSPVCLQMSHQITNLRECMITLGAFVWLFSIVYFQVCPKITYISKRTHSHTALIALFCLFPMVCFQMCL